jgi:hypothetical protein
MSRSDSVAQLLGVQTLSEGGNDTTELFAKLRRFIDLEAQMLPAERK